MFWNQAAYLNNVYTFDSAHISTPNSSSLNITGSFTEEAWINCIWGGGVAWPIITKYNGYDMYIYWYGTGMRIFLGSGNNWRLNTRTYIPFNTWTHVSCVYDNPSNRFSIYLNGVLDTTCVIAGAAPISNTQPLLIGWDNSKVYFPGYLDDIRIWNRALSASEVASMNYISVGAPGTGSYNGLVLSYTFQTRSSQGSTFS